MSSSWFEEMRIWGHLDPKQLDFAKGWIDVSGDPLAQVDASRWKCDTVDGWNPSNQLIGSLSNYFSGFYASRVVQDFFHQQ